MTNPHDRTTGLHPAVDDLHVTVPHDLALELVYALDELDARQALDPPGRADDITDGDGVEVDECGTCSTQLALIAAINRAVHAHETGDLTGPRTGRHTLECE